MNVCLLLVTLSVSAHILGVFLYSGTSVKQNSSIPQAQWNEPITIQLPQGLWSGLERVGSLCQVLEHYLKQGGDKNLLSGTGKYCWTDYISTIKWNWLEAFFPSSLPHRGLAHQWTANWLCSGPRTQLSWGGHNVWLQESWVPMTECQNLWAAGRTICASHFFDCVASSNACRFLVGAWNMLDSVPLQNQGDGLCLITTLAVWSNICSPYAFFFFMLLNMKNSTSWYIHTHTHKYKCSLCTLIYWTF